MDPMDTAMRFLRQLADTGESSAHQLVVVCAMAASMGVARGMTKEHFLRCMGVSYDTLKSADEQMRRKP